MKRGIFITLEGGEGVGKTTQMNFIKNWFEEHNLPYIITHEPGGTALGDELRTILKHAKYEIPPKAELLLMNASRAALTDQIIKPALNNRINVISDRFYDSGIAYQGFARGLNMNEVMEICSYATDHIQPDITFWFDIKPELAFARKFGTDNDRFEKTGIEFHNKVYEGYKYLADTYSRIKRIDATKSVEEVSAQIDYYLTQKFLSKKETK